MKLTPVGEVHYDCTSTQHVDWTGIVTVADLLNEISKRYEWGSISITDINSENGFSSFEYHGDDFGSIPEYLLNAEIYNVKACGAYKMMNYEVYLKYKRDE